MPIGLSLKPRPCSGSRGRQRTKLQREPGEQPERVGHCEDEWGRRIFRRFHRQSMKEVGQIPVERRKEILDQKVWRRSWSLKSPIQWPSRSTTGRTLIWDARFSMSAIASRAGISGIAVVGFFVMTSSARS
jgi:hypothetical protein